MALTRTKTRFIFGPFASLPAYVLIAVFLGDAFYLRFVLHDGDARDMTPGDGLGALFCIFIVFMTLLIMGSVLWFTFIGEFQSALPTLLCPIDPSNLTHMLD
jgi:hypothetical protein